MQWRVLRFFGAAFALLGFGLIRAAQVGPVSQAPTITLINFLSRIEPDGQPVVGVVRFEAPKSDVVQIEMKVVQALDANGQDIRKTSDIKDATWDPGVKGQSKGEFPFQVITRIVQRVTMAATLIGSESGRGPSKQFSWVAGSFPPPGMVLIPAGSFQMGDSFGEGDSDERPVHTVFVSAFYMDKYEVTKTLWDEVANWAASHSYDIKPGDGDGKAADHPVYNVSWYEAVKWANARSEKEGLAPCYTVGGNVYRTGQSVPDCNWTANGYRLPTEAEWEKAARGGVAGHRYPWSDTDTIDHSRANYDNGNGTSPVGSFAPNGYGLYDMAGNVREWVWDWYSDTYYSASPGSDPRGPASGSRRVMRGGCWLNIASDCRVAFRDFYSPGLSGYVGIRLVRTAP